MRVGKGFRFTFAYTVDDLETVRDLSMRATVAGRPRESRGCRRLVRSLIGGERVATAQHFPDISPIDQRILAEVSRAAADEVDHAVRAAHDAFPAWAALGPGRPRLPPPARRPDRCERRALAAVECEDMAMLLRSLRRA